MINIRRIFICSAAFVQGIFLAVFLQFILNDFIDIQGSIRSHHVGIDEDIRQFFLDIFQVLKAFLGAFPLEDFKKFGSFSEYGQGQVFGIVELPPMTVIKELIDFIQSIHGDHVPFVNVVGGGERQDLRHRWLVREHPVWAGHLESSR